MIQLSEAGKHFGSKTLFEELNWVINSGERTGLVGGNGTGKSTLLKILAGLETPDHGARSISKGMTTGYLPQDGLALSGRSVVAECMSVFDDLLEIEKEMETLTHQMGELDPASQEFDKVMDRYHRIQTEFQNRDGYTLEAQASAVLNGLGFSNTDMQRSTEEFSGGWQMRIGLAKLLLTKPNLLLLDEPTNHLDLEARNWLEEYLHEYPHAIVLVSHDRYFLDVVVNRILEIWNKKTYFYTGNYETFLKQKEERRANLESSYRNQKDRIEQIEAFINRFRYQATKAKQVQSRIKELDKIERIEVPPDEKIIHFSFPQPPQSGRMVAEFKNVSKTYGNTKVFDHVNFTLARGDRVALVGVNGAGKSTLIKLLSGAEPVSTGEFRLGHNVEVDYFAQDQYKALDPEARLLDDLTSFAPAAVSNQTRLRTLLGCFLFSDDDVFKPIKVLSGGERNRYALARMLLRPANCLLLDEPTNHLDMQAKDVLLEALRKYTGTVVFVSHDRYFIDNLATRIFEIQVGQMTDYPGNYEDYRWQKERPAAPVVTNGNASRGAAKMVVNDGAPAGAQTAPLDGGDAAKVAKPETAAAPVKKVNAALVRKMERRRIELEQEIERCETEISEHELQLVHFKSAEESIRLSKIIGERRAELTKALKDWEEIAAKLEVQTEAGEHEKADSSLR